MSGLSRHISNPKDIVRCPTAASVGLIVLIGRSGAPRPAAVDGAHLTRVRIATLNISLDMFDLNNVSALELIESRLDR